jgi:uncharacterized Zn-binding protein involved in type VI secretion
VGVPAAKQGDQVIATDKHQVQSVSGATSLNPSPFTGIINGGLSSNVNIMGMPAATQNSTASNTPPHVPVGGTFVNPPTNKGTITTGSATVNINGNPAARNGDTALTCNDPSPLQDGQVVATGTVMIG